MNKEIFHLFLNLKIDTVERSIWKISETFIQNDNQVFYSIIKTAILFAYFCLKSCMKFILSIFFIVVVTAGSVYPTRSLKIA